MIQKDLLKVKMSLMSSKIPVDQLNQCPAKCFDRLFGMDLKLKVSKSIRKILVNNSMRQLFAPGGSTYFLEYVIWIYPQFYENKII